MHGNSKTRALESKLISLKISRYGLNYSPPHSPAQTNWILTATFWLLAPAERFHYLHAVQDNTFSIKCLMLVSICYLSNRDSPSGRWLDLDFFVGLWSKSLRLFLMLIFLLETKNGNDNFTLVLLKILKWSVFRYLIEMFSC